MDIHIPNHRGLSWNELGHDKHLGRDRLSDRCDIDLRQRHEVWVLLIDRLDINLSFDVSLNRNVSRRQQTATRSWPTAR